MSWDDENWKTVAREYVRDNPVNMVSPPGYFDVPGPQHESGCTCWRCILMTARDIALMVEKWR